MSLHLKQKSAPPLRLGVRFFTFKGIFYQEKRKPKGREKPHELSVQMLGTF